MLLKGVHEGAAAGAGAGVAVAGGTYTVVTTVGGTVEGTVGGEAVVDVVVDAAVVVVATVEVDPLPADDVPQAATAIAATTPTSQTRIRLMRSPDRRAGRRLRLRTEGRKKSPSYRKAVPEKHAGRGSLAHP